MAETPLFLHDNCGSCVFLGTYIDQDLYFCDEYSPPIVMARYGDEGYEYTSDLLIAKAMSEHPVLGRSHLVEARRRAIAAGLMKEDDPHA